MTDYTELKSRLRNGIDFDDSKEAADAIESLQRKIAEKDTEIRKLIAAVADHVTVRCEQAEAIRVKDEAILLVINDDESLWAIGENGSKKLTTALAILPSPEILAARDQRVIAEYLASMSHKESGE